MSREPKNYNDLTDSTKCTSRAWCLLFRQSVVRRLVFMIRCLVIFSILFAVAAHAATVASLSAGAPQFMGKKLSPKNYVVVKARKLARPKIVWVNLDYLRELGVDVPARGMTPDLENAL